MEEQGRVRLAILEGRAAKEEVSYILKQVGGDGEKAHQVCSKCLAKKSRTVPESPEEDSPGQLSQIVEYQDPSTRRQKGLGSGHPGGLRRKCL